MACRDFSTEELRSAWQQCRRSTWPTSFEEAMNDPIYFRLIRLEAGVRARRAQRQVKAPQRRLSPAIPVTPPLLDLKRRAAGERDDD